MFLLGYNKKIDMIGKRFGRLVVTREKPIEEYPDHKRPCVAWYCDCDCGTKDHLVDGTTLRSGRVKSCGCLTVDSAKNSYIDITGKRFGMLTAIHRVEQPEYVNCEMGAWWLCKCDCGNTKSVAYSSLKNGGVKSCGCLISNGERIIREILLKNNVHYKSQYSFDDCVSPITGRKLKFDFAIFDINYNFKCLIEFDGHQHYFGTRFSHDNDINKRKFEQLKLHDKTKDMFCEEKNILLIRIPYWQIDNIEKILDENLKEDCYAISD